LAINLEFILCGGGEAYLFIIQVCMAAFGAFVLSWKMCIGMVKLVKHEFSYGFDHLVIPTPFLEVFKFVFRMQD